MLVHKRLVLSLVINYFVVKVNVQTRLSSWNQSTPFEAIDP